MTALKRNKKKVSDWHYTTTTTTTTNQKGNDVGAMGGDNADTLLWQFVRSHTTNRNGRSSTTIIKWIIVISAVALFILRLFIDNESIFNKIDDNGYDYDYYYKSLISIPAAIRTKNKIADVNANANADVNADADDDFSVNFDINFNNPQIVILAGPHKTASTT